MDEGISRCRPTDHRIKEILAEIENNLSQSLSIIDMAASKNVSVSHLRHLFKQEVGTSITKHVKGVRMNTACKLLETTNLLVKEIRTKIGIKDESHFMHDFKTKYGLAPTQYRRKI